MLQDVKNYVRLDIDEDDILINSLIEAAELYLKNAGVKNTKDDLYFLALKMLVLHWYENRESVLVGSISKKLEFSLSNIITQLTYCYEG